MSGYVPKFRHDKEQTESCEWGAWAIERDSEDLAVCATSLPKPHILR